jgi:benzoyl-CoA reductase/2-hydroxyglutaryl-CoA dehydratase subunit BcrC/BadD/HgdB
MARFEELLTQFVQAADNPRAQMDRYIAQGKKVIGCFPYYVPEELVHAAGMVPFGIWGAEGTIKAAKKYFPPFYCTVAQMWTRTGPCWEIQRPLRRHYSFAVRYAPPVDPELPGSRT